MNFDPATVCARTLAGEGEIVKPSHGLSLGQRRLLSLLEDPCVLEEFVAAHGLAPDRVQRDLARLVATGLVTLNSPNAQPAATPVPSMSADAPAPRAWHPGVLAALGAALVAALAWLARR